MKNSSMAIYVLASSFIPPISYGGMERKTWKIYSVLSSGAQKNLRSFLEMLGGVWFDFLLKTKIENFKTCHWWGKMKFFWAVSISGLKHVSLSSTDLSVLSLTGSYLSLWTNRPIMGLNYISVAAQVSFFILLFIQPGLSLHTFVILLINNINN